MQARILWKQAGAELAIKQTLKKLTNISPKKRSVSVIDVPGILIRSGAGDLVCAKIAQWVSLETLVG
jgi:hypothetical protein